MTRRTQAKLSFRVREQEVPGPDRVRRGLALWGEYLLRHLVSPPRNGERAARAEEEM